MGPAYLQDMLKYGNLIHNVQLVEPRVQTMMGDRAFQKYAPKLWNSTPAQIKESGTLEGFKTTLKTHLFESTYKPN